MAIAIRPAAGSGARAARVAALALAALAGAVAVVLSYRIATGPPIRGARWAMFDQIAAWWVVFGGGAALVLHAPRRAAMVLICVVAVALRAAAVAGPPRLSLDLLRYAWDGRVQAAGIDPYRYRTDAPQTASLRVAWLWPPPAVCRAHGHPPGCSRINRPHARTIYPPAAQAWFLAVHEATGGRAHERGWQIAGLLTDLAALAAMLALLRALGRDPRWLVLYAWSPVAVLEAVQNGHVDGVAVLLVVGALAALRRRPALAGGLLGVATLVKLYPALLALLLVPRGRRRGLAAFAGVVVLGYLPHVVAAGPRVLGYLPGYLHEEGYASGQRFRTLALLGLHGTAAQLAALLVLALVVVVTARSDRLRTAPEAAATWLIGSLLLVTTPVQPWYAVVLAALATVAVAPAWLAVAAAGYPLFFLVLVGGPAWASRGAYGLALAAVPAAALITRLRRRSEQSRTPAVAGMSGMREGRQWAS